MEDEKEDLKNEKEDALARIEKLKSESTDLAAFEALRSEKEGAE